MAYQYDLFLSYPRGNGVAARWLHESLLPLLEPYLLNALGRPPSLFVDNTMRAGDAWPQRLRSALARSRILTPVFCVEYFYSEWCRRECSVFLWREQELGMRTNENPSGLVVPMSAFDGVHFPAIARDIQSWDGRRFLRIGKAFEESILFLHFQDQLLSWAEDLAEVIRSSPPWQEAWLEDAWIANAFKHYGGRLAPSGRTADAPHL